MNNDISPIDLLLEQKVKQFHEIIDIANENMAYCTVDENLNVLYVSKLFSDILGYSIDTFKDDTFSSIILKESTSKFYNGCEYVKNNGRESWGTEIIFESIEGKDIYTNLIINPTFQSSKLVGFIFVIHDTTNEKLLHKLQVKMFAQEEIKQNTLEFVSSTSAAILDTISYKVSVVVKIVVSFIILFLLYTTIFDIDEIARGTGSFVPSSKVQQLKNYESGVISQIYVTEGDSVKKDQILVKFNNIAHKAKLDENKIRLSELKAKVARLKAESLGIDMEKLTCLDDCDKEQFDLEKTFYISNMRELQKNLSKQKEQLKSKESSLQDAEHRFEILKTNYKILSDEFKIKKALEKQKIFTRYELGQLERELNDAQSEKRSAQEMIIQTKTQIQEIKNGIDESVLTFKNKASLQYNEVSAEISRLEEAKKNLQDVISRTIIRSPISGVIKELFVHTLGSAIESSAKLLSIVPDNYEIVAEIKIPPAEIAKLHIGQKVKLKVTAFDYSIYGDLDGKIIFISPDTITDKDTGENFYIAHVKTKVNYLKDNEKYKVKIGMMVNADILVGKKSIMSFLLKPILKATEKH